MSDKTNEVVEECAVGYISGYAELYVPRSSTYFTTLDIQFNDEPIIIDCFSEPLYQTGMLDAFIVRIEPNFLNKVITVNSGFTPEQRVEFWQRREELVNHKIKFILDASHDGVFVSL